MMFKPIGMMIPFIRMVSQLKDSEKVQDIKDAIDERDKEKVWKVMKNGGTESLSIEQWKDTEPFCHFCTFEIAYSKQVFNWTFALKHFLLSNRYII